MVLRRLGEVKGEKMGKQKVAPKNNSALSNGGNRGPVYGLKNSSSEIEWESDERVRARKGFGWGDDDCGRRISGGDRRGR